MVDQTTFRNPINMRGTFLDSMVNQNIADTPAEDSVVATFIKKPRFFGNDEDVTAFLLFIFEFISVILACILLYIVFLLIYSFLRIKLAAFRSRISRPRLDRDQDPNVQTLVFYTPY